VHRAPDDRLYFYTGRPSRFFRYDTASGKLDDLGAPANRAAYHLNHAIAPDGKMYVGSYPDARLVSLDPATGKTRDFGRLAEDPKQKYIIRTAVSDDNMIYCGVGQHHAELWVVDPQTGEKRQILPESLTKLQAAPYVYTGKDGKVYGRHSGRWFQCFPDRIEFVEEAAAERRRAPDLAGNEQPLHVNGDGELVLADAKTRAVRKVKTDFEGVTTRIFSVAAERDGVIYGGGISPATFFSHNTATGEKKDYGFVTGGKIQVYDVLSHPRGLFLSSYMGACQDLFDPVTKKRTPIAKLGGPDCLQERARALALGPDGRIYTGTYPVKGRLGGAIVRIDPKDLSCQVWPGVIEDQSFNWVVAVPATGEMFYTTNVQGGTSAIPTQKEAFVALWDVEKEAIVWKDTIIPGTTAYGEAVLGSNGLIYGLAGRKYYAFDPASRKVVQVGDVPFEGRFGYPALWDFPAGPDKLVYGIGGSSVFVIDPKNHAMRVLAKHPSLAATYGILAREDGSVYYGSGSNLWRMRSISEN
jgi:streptogramin lyase